MVGVSPVEESQAAFGLKGYVKPRTRPTLVDRGLKHKPPTRLTGLTPPARRGLIPLNAGTKHRPEGRRTGWREALSRP